MEIDLGEMFYLDMEIVEQAPYPDIYIGPRRRIDPGPPTTRALADALARWQVELETKPSEVTGSGKPDHAQPRADHEPSSSDRSA